MSNIIQFPFKSEEKQQSVDEWFEDFEASMLEDADDTSSEVIKVAMASTRKRIDTIITKMRDGVPLKYNKLPESEKELLEIIQNTSAKTNQIITDLIVAVLFAEMDINLAINGLPPLNRGPK